MTDVHETTEIHLTTLTVTGVSAPDEPLDLSAISQEVTDTNCEVTNSADTLRWLQRQLGRGRLAGMFNRQGAVVFTPREGDEGYVQLTRDERNSDGPAQIQPVSKVGLAARIDLTHHVFKETTVTRPNGQTFTVQTHSLFPLAVTERALAVPDLMPNVRPLDGVIHTPVVRPNGSILDTPGYDEGSRLLYLPERGLDVPRVAESPSAGDVERAVKLIDEMLCDFIFVSDHDRANFVGMLLTPVLRLFVPPPYKLGVINAPMPGAGKSLLASCLRIAHSGIFRSEMPESSAELRKQITTILGFTTGAVVQLDNVTGTIRSSVLAGLLTNATWDDRTLGVMKMAFCHNDRLWVLTGNNVALGGDLSRRAFWTTIDPGVPQPHLRTGFKDLEAWTRSNRGHLLWALLTLVRAWVAAGALLPDKPTSDSYGRWVETVRGIMVNAHMAGIFNHEDTDQTSGIGTDDEEWRTFLDSVYEVFQHGDWTVTDVLERVERTGLGVFAQGGSQAGQPGRIPLDSLPSAIADKIIKAHGETAGVRRTLGQWLRNRTGRWAGEYSVHKAGQRQKEATWTVKVTRERVQVG